MYIKNDDTHKKAQPWQVHSFKFYTWRKSRNFGWFILSFILSKSKDIIQNHRL